MNNNTLIDIIDRINEIEHISKTIKFLRYSIDDMNNKDLSRSLDVISLDLIDRVTMELSNLSNDLLPTIERE